MRRKGRKVSNAKDVFIFGEFSDRSVEPVLAEEFGFGFHKRKRSARHKLLEPSSGAGEEKHRVFPVDMSAVHPQNR